MFPVNANLIGPSHNHWQSLYFLMLKYLSILLLEISQQKHTKKSKTSIHICHLTASMRLGGFKRTYFWLCTPILVTQRWPKRLFLHDITLCLLPQNVDISKYNKITNNGSSWTLWDKHECKNSPSDQQINNTKNDNVLYYQAQFHPCRFPCTYIHQAFQSLPKILNCTID